MITIDPAFSGFVIICCLAQIINSTRISEEEKQTPIKQLFNKRTYQETTPSFSL